MDKQKNKITALADEIRDGSITPEALKGFIKDQFPLLRNSKSQNAEDSQTPVKPENVEEPEAYAVAHSLFERMVEERMLAEAILEDPTAWNYEESQKAQAAQGLREHAEDFYKLAEKLLVVAWHGYERA